MATDTTLRRTALYPLHKGLGARFVDFHGWELPIQFTSILKEHQAVRTQCGVFDVSHMGQILVEGPQALDFLQYVNSNDVRRAGPGHALYSHLLNERGGVVDDVILSCLAPGRYLMVVNAATADKDSGWLRRHAPGYEVRLDDQSDRYSMLAIQGPHARRVVADMLPSSFELPRFGVLETELFGQPCIVQRTGYTGEDGLELMVPPDVSCRLWDELMTRGRSLGMLACGLGSRDTLRLEAGLLLYGTDIDEERTPLQARYDWVVKFDKGEFLGREALLRQRQFGLAETWRGVKLLERGVPRPAAAVFHRGHALGRLTSATYSPTLNIGIGAGYLRDADSIGDDDVEVEMHGRRARARLVPLPFYRRSQGETP